MEQESQNELFELLGKIQSDRLDEQRCNLPAVLINSVSEGNSSTEEEEEEGTMPENYGRSDSIDLEPVKKVLASGGPYPLVVLPVSGEYWLEGSNHQYAADDMYKMVPRYDVHKWCVETDPAAECYRKSFIGKEHLNFMCDDEKLGPVILSVKQEMSLDIDSQGLLRVVLRTSERTITDLLPLENLSDNYGPREIIKYLLGDEVEALDQFQVVAYPRASELILKYDEHMLLPAFKFGIIYQQFGQITEEEYFNNRSHGSAMNEFLDLLGARVYLKDFKGFHGGLDVKHGQTGDTSVHTVFNGKEIMFHVSTLLPFSSGDAQQVQRKRHIGNDIVSIVFQDDNTPFSPISIRSHFLHVFIVVQVENPNSSNTRYKVSVTAKEDVPAFGPKLPNPAVFKKGPEFRKFLLTKLINAEMSALKSTEFSRLADRTRSSLLKNLFDELVEKNAVIFDMGVANDGASGNQKGLLTSLRKAIRGRTSPVIRTASMNSTRSAEETEIADDSQMAAKKQKERRKSSQSFLKKKSPKPEVKRNNTRSKSMESLATDRIQPQNNGQSSTFFISHSPRTTRAMLDPQNSKQEDKESIKSRSEYLIAKPVNYQDSEQAKSGFYRVSSTPLIDPKSYNSDSSGAKTVPRTQYDGSPKTGVRYIGGYSNSPESGHGTVREQSPVKMINYERSPGFSRRSSEPIEVIRPQPRRAASFRVSGERRRNLDYTGDYDKELRYLPQQLQQVTQQIHQQHNLSPESNPNTPEYNTALLLSYRRSREDLLDNSSNQSPSASPSLLRKVSDPLYNHRISPSSSPPTLVKAKKTAVVSPLLDVKYAERPRPRSVPPGLLMFDPTDPESEGYQQVMEQTSSVSQNSSNRSLTDREEEIENLRKQVESLTNENACLKSEKKDLERQLVLLERENKEAEDQNLRQTVELYEARCKIARLQSLQPSENVVRQEKATERTVTRHTRL